MAGYAHKREDYLYTKHVNGDEEGTKVYVDDGSDTLPELGDTFGLEDATDDCTLRSIQISLLGAANKKYLCTYATPQTSSGSPMSKDDEPVSLRISYDAIDINQDNAATKVTWVSGKVIPESISLVKKVFVADYSVIKNYSTMNKALSGVGTRIGKLWKTVESKWLFLGVSIDEGKDKDGLRLYRVTRQYQWRSIAWNLFYNSETDAWEALSKHMFPDVATSFLDVMPALSNT